MFKLGDKVKINIGVGYTLNDAEGTIIEVGKIYCLYKFNETAEKCFVVKVNYKSGRYLSFFAKQLKLISDYPRHPLTSIFK